VTVKSKVEISQNFVAFSEYMNTTGPIQIENCSAGPVLMRPTENYFDAYHAHLHIMRDLKKIKAVKKRLSLELFKILYKKHRNCKGELHFQLFLELSCCKKRQKFSIQETGLVNKETTEGSE
jgi:hypothetical protein